MVEENFENFLSQTSQNGSYYFCVMIIFTMVEENFENCFFQTSQDGSILLFWATLLHHGWRKFWNSVFWNAPDWIDFDTFNQHYFTIVEENFEIRCSECSRLNWFWYLLPTLLHHGWRKFWNVAFWNAPDWIDFYTFWKLLFISGAFQISKFSSTIVKVYLWGSVKIKSIRTVSEHHISKFSSTMVK